LFKEITAVYIENQKKPLILNADLLFVTATGYRSAVKGKSCNEKHDTVSVTDCGFPPVSSFTARIKGKPTLITAQSLSLR
jgi:hypothetical protein